jgi:TatD DNase family protein
MTSPLFIDSHAHIDGREFRDDFAAMLDRAAAAGVGHIVVVGADLQSSRAAAALASRYPQMSAVVGIHPHDAASVTAACYDEIRCLARENERVVAIGEIGLDFFRDRSPRNQQEQVFRRFIRMAREVGKPLVIHDRDAHERLMTILREEQAQEVGGVLHCFSGDLAMAQECIAMGFLLSIPGTITYPANEALREVVRGVKIEQLLIETDCPYLSPVPHRGKRNEPAFVALTAAKIAELKGLTVEDVGRITTLNTQRLFRFGEAAQQARIAYRIRNALYLNITNRCSNRCSFCAKFDDFTVKGHYLHLDHEPTAAEVLAAVGTPTVGQEIVFCGYGEPLLRLDLVKEVAAVLKAQGCHIRINTDGQANLVHGRNILPELAGLVDSISVSLNAADAETYARLCTTPFGVAGFQGVCDFLRAAGAHIPQVTATAVALPGLDMAPIRQLAADLGVVFREREYAEVG